MTSAPAHTVLSVQRFLTKNGTANPLYSPDLALSNFFLFPWMKKVLKGKSFAHVEEAKQKITEVLKASTLMRSKLLSSGKNVSGGALHQTESTLKVTEISICKHKYTIF